MFPTMFPRRTTRSWFRQAVCYCVVGGVLVLFGGSAQGAEGTWNVPGGGGWDDPANWLGSVPNGPGDVALFDVLQPTDSAIVRLNSPITVGRIDQANPNRLEIGGSHPLLLDAAGSGGVVRIRLAEGAGDLAIGAPVTLSDDDLIATVVPEDSWLELPQFTSSGSSNLTKDGAGGLTLGGDNPTWTGLVTVDEGTLQVRTNTALGAGSGTDADATTVQAAGTLLIKSGRTIAGEKIRLAGGTLASGTLGGDTAGTTTIGGPIELLADSVLTNLGPDGKLKLTGAVSGPGGALVGQGTVDLWGPLSFAGPLQVKGGTARVRVASTHGGSEVRPGGRLLVTKIGSLVGAGQTTVREGGELRLVKPAGEDPATSSVAPGSVVLDGGTLTLANGDFDPGTILSSASAGGRIALENVPVFTAGGTSVIDFDWAGGQIRLGAKTDAIVPSIVSLLPDSATHSVRFGGAPATLTIESSIEDAGGEPTNVEHASGGVVISGDNTYTGRTIINGGTFTAASPTALGDDSEGTVVQDGNLWLKSPSAEPVRIERGGRMTMFDSAAGYSGTVTLDGGQLAMFVHTTDAPVVVTSAGGTVITTGTWTGGATGTGPLKLNGGVVATRPLAHDGDLELTGNISLDIANTYTGKTTVTGGATINHADALGTSTSPVRVDGGGLLLNVVPARDYDVVGGGGLSFLTSTELVGNTITLGDGSPGSWGRINTRGELTALVTIPGESEGWISRGTFNGTITGDGDLRLGSGQFPRSPPVELNGPNTLTGTTRIMGGVTNVNHVEALDPTKILVNDGRLNLNVPTDAPIVMIGGTVALNTAQDFTTPWVISRGFLDASVEVGMSQLLILGRGGLAVESGGSVRIDDELRVIQDGDIQGGLAGSGALRLVGRQLTLEGDLSGFDGDILVESGSLILSQNTVLGSTPGAVHVFDRGNGVIQLRGDTVLEKDIFLHNVQGPSGSGAFEKAGGTPTLRGRLDVGDQGSTVGGNFLFSGTLTGRNLTLRDASFAIQTPQRDLQGVLRLDRSRVSLEESGQLGGLDAVVLEKRSVLDITAVDASSSIPPDRVGDTIPIRSRGGEVNLYSMPDQATTETFGALRLERGHTTISAIGDDGSPPATLTFAELVRDRGAIVVFGNVGRQGEVRIANPPALVNGMIGGWAWTDNGFATIGPAGIETLAATATDLNLAGLTDHVLTTTEQTLSADTVIASLATDWPGYGMIDLNGYELAVASGGFLADGGTNITNGRLTAGIDADAELVIAFTSSANVRADIVDNSAGGSVSLVAVVGESNVLLNGNNSYTGGTWVTSNAGLGDDDFRGELYVEGLSAVPTDDRVHVDGGVYNLRIGTGKTVSLAELHLREGGWVRAGGAAVDAADYFLEDGRISPPLTGSGAIVKETGGTVFLDGPSPNFSGSVTVRGGVLSLAPGAVGDVDIVVDGGRLEASSLTNNVVVNGGGLGAGRYLGEIDVEGEARLTADDRIEVKGDLIGTGNLTLQGPMSFSGDNSRFSGDVRVESGSLRVARSDGAGTGDVRVMSGSQLVVGGRYSDDPTVVLDNRIDLFGGLLIGAGGIVTGEVTVHDDAFIGASPDHGLKISGRLVLSDGSTVFSIGEFYRKIDPFGNIVVDFPGQLLVGADTAWHLLPASVDFTGTIQSNAPQASINFVGLPSSLYLASSSIRVQEEQSLAILVNGEPASLDIEGAGNTIEGNGVLANNIGVTEGAAISPGESVGMLTIGLDAMAGGDGPPAVESGAATFGQGGVYQWEINDALGTAGAGDGWDLLTVTQTLDVAATEDDPFVLRLVGLDEAGQEGAVAGFDGRRGFDWLIASAGQVTGFDPARLAIDASGFLSHNATAPASRFALQQFGGDLTLVYRVPEPSTLWLLAVAMGIAAVYRRRSNGPGVKATTEQNVAIKVSRDRPVRKQGTDSRSREQTAVLGNRQPF